MKPIDLSYSDFEIDMSIEEVKDKLEGFVENQDYTQLLNSYYFFRARDGQSVVIEIRLIEQAYRVANIYTYSMTELAGRGEYEKLEKGITVPELVARVGIPVKLKGYSGRLTMDFPMADGRMCEIDFSQSLSSDMTIQMVLTRVNFV